jgi:hypothetical protein
MARNIAPEEYVFDPVLKKITINRYIQEKHIFLIVNSVSNKVLFNFSDPTLTATVEYIYPTYSISNTTAESVYKTTITLTGSGANTTGMTSSDVLQIILDDEDQKVTFDDTFIDGAQKLRTSTPQSLMDTDFEYSVQPSKWESLFLANGYPSFFAKGTGGNSFDVITVTGDGIRPRSTITVTTALPHGLSPGQIVSVQETLNFLAEGTSLVTATPTTTTFQYTARGAVSGDIQSGTLTSIYGGDIFDGAHIPGGNFPIGGINTLNRWRATTDGAAPVSTVTVIFDQPHGVFPGNLIVVSGTNSIDGNWQVTKVATQTSLEFQLSRQQSAVSVPTTALIFTKGDSYVVHRPYDGGVSISTATNSMGSQVIRQTRRYFRYQSGKGMQFSTGAQLTPVYDVEQLFINGGSIGPAIVTVKTVQDHGMQAGVKIDIEGVKTRFAYNPFNGEEIAVTRIIDVNTFEYAVNLTQTLPAVDWNPAGTNVYVHARKWFGAVTRTGMYDDQNGFYFEYDGQKMYACRRHSEKEGIGRVNVVKNSSFVTGLNTQFRKQLTVGQSIVIKGSSYKIVSINSATSMNISPAYRGATGNRTRYLLTQSDRFSQELWNVDKFDGTGPSGYKLDMGRMQMVYIDYTWYGAGTIRFGMRGPNGKIYWCHRMPQNNVNNSAYQRSGNLPARYEVSNDPSIFTKMIAGAGATLGAQLAPNDLSLWVEDASAFPPAGFIYVRDGVNCEIMRYSSIDAYNATPGGYRINIAERRASITQVYPDLPFTYSGTKTSVTFTPDSSITGVGGDAQVAVQSITQNCAPIISHWGSSVIMDGRFDNDANFIFTGGMTKLLNVAPGVTRPLIAIRLAPSVDNAIARNFGIRELMNRMQLQLNSIGVSTNGQFRIDGILNPAQILYNNYTPANLTSTRSSVTGTAGTNTITISDTTGTTGIIPGMLVSGTGIGAGAQISAVTANIISLSVPNSGTVSGSITFVPRTGFIGLPDDWGRDLVGSGSLAQVIYFDNSGPGAGNVQTASGRVLGGDSVASFFTENGGGGTNYNVSNYDLRSVRDLGNSVISGDGNISSPSYPNGPDVLVLTATNIGTTATNISARISWIEAQA